jgi:predicted phage tail protein
MANLNSVSFANILDLVSEGEIEGLKEGRKSIFLNNVELLNKTAILKSGTYSQSAGTITVTINSHGYVAGQSLAVDITSGDGISDTYTVGAVATNTFTLTAKNQATTSGNVTISKSADYNFQNVTIVSRNGTNDQSYIPGNSEISKEVGVGVAVLKDTPVVRTITDQTTNAARITLGFPRLQTFQDDGGVGGSSVQINIDVQYGGAGFSNVINDTVTGRADDNYQKDYIVNLNGAFPVDIRVARVTADNTSPKIVNEFNWNSYTELIYSKLRYPHSALVSLRFAAEQFSSIPQRSYLIRGIKISIPNNATVDSNSGALVYNGVWNGVFAATKQWTSDPAWCLWTLLTNTRFGFGEYLNAALLDKWSFFEASKYASALNTYTSSAEILERAKRGLQPRTGSTDNYHETTGRHGVPDGFGKYEPRFSCNVNIQSQEEAYTVINNLCSVFRAMPFWSTGSLTVTQDKPVASSYLFTLANVNESGFSYSGSSQKARATVVIVSYFDTTMRTLANEYVEDQAAIAKYGVNTKKVEAFACTSRGQAHRLGLWMLYAENRETEIIAFTASIDSGVIVRPGQVVDVADPMRAGSRRGGRISSATTSVVTVDNATGLTTDNSPTLSVLLPDGTVETRPVSLSGINGNEITVSSSFSTAPNNNSVWVFQSTDIQTSQWRVISVTEQEECQYVINALAYNPSKYDAVEYGLALTDRDVTNLNELPAAPTDISFTESLYTYQAEVRSKLVIGWLPVVGVNQYQIKWRKDYGNWSIVTLQGVDYEILSTTPGLYEAEIYSLNATNKQSLTALTGSVQALGKTAPPSDIEIFTATIDPSVGVTLNWDAVTDLDLQGYEIWQGPSWGTGIHLGVFNATSKKLGLIGPGTTTWWIKALDTSGSYSTNAISASLTISVPGAPTVAGVFSNDSLILSWSAVTGSLSTAYYEVRYGTVSDTWESSSGQVVGTVQGTTLSIKGAWLGTRRFFVAAIDITGNVGAIANCDALITAPSEPLIAQQVIDNNVLLQWTDATQTLPITEYELRKGATWAGATVIGTKQGKFTTVFETAAGTYTYWLAGIDSAGNYGTPGDISAQVNQPPDYVLKLDQNSTFTGTKTNLATIDTGLLASVNTTETWQSHFTSRSWTTPQDQINAGFPVYIMPSQNTGQYYEDIDYGTVLAGTKVSTTLTSVVVTGVTTITPTISIKKLVGDPWIVYSGSSSVFATDFRYIRTQYDFTSSGNNDLLEITALNTRLDAKIRSNSGNGTANATDSGGTVVNFTLTPAFVDVDSIVVTPAGVTSVTAVYDFVDAPNPTSFKVLLFSASGTRMSGAFSWSARGV